jgi:translocation and assembly module TamB
VLGPVEPAGEEPSIPAAGRVRVGGRVTGSPEAFQVVAAVDARDVRRGSLRMTHVGGTATYVSAARSVRVDAAIDRGSVADVPVRDLELRVAGLPDSLNWQGRSRFGEFAAWIGGGRWQGAPGAWSVTLDSLGLLLASGPWFVERGSAIAVDDSGIGFGGFTLARAQGSGRLTLDGRFPLVGAASLTGAIEALPIEDALALAGRDEVPAAGELSGTVRLQGTAREPLIDVAVAVRNGSYLDFQAPYTEGTLNYRDRRLAGTLQLYRRGERIMSIELGVPLDLALAGATRRRLSGPLRVEAIAEGLDLSLLEATAPQVRDIAGTLDARFGVRGSWEDPVLAGQITVRDGAATIPALGVRHSQVNGTLALAGDTIKVESFAVRSGSGVALIGGYVRLEELSRAVLDLRVNSRDFEAMNVRDFLAVTATADLTLKGPLEHPVLTGRATATRGVLYFADLITKQIVNLEDTLFAEFVDTALVRHQRLGAEFENRFLDSLRIDSLRVQLGSDFWLRSSEANVQLSGTVHVNKVRDRYVFDGTLEAPRGTYRLQLGLGTTREFRVTRGQVRYLGTSDLNADLDLDAEHVVRTLRGENVKIGVHIGGSLYDPRLTLSSDVRPALSESEIISYLMFGAPSFQAGTQSGELGNRIVTQQVFGALSSQFEYALISDLGIPLDYLQIQPATTGGELSAVEALVGKHFEVLGTSAFLTISPRVCSRQELSAAMGASLEFRLTRNWLVAAGVDPRLACGVLTPTITTNYEFGLDLYWEKRY